MTDERETRIQGLQALYNQGINPYPNTTERTHTIAEVLQHFNELVGPEGSYTLVGRIRLLREMGKENYRLIKLLDLGDFIQANGFLFTTRTGEHTLHVRHFHILAKGLRPL